MSKTSFQQTLKAIKKEAKSRTKSTARLLMYAQEEVAREHGFSNFHEIRELAAKEEAAHLFDVAEILDLPVRTPIVYHIKIGDSAWSLRTSEKGPRLCLEYSPCSFENEISENVEMGIFPVIVPASKIQLTQNQYSEGEFAIARYGMYPNIALGFMN